MENLNPYQLRILLPEGREKMRCTVWVTAMNPAVVVFGGYVFVFPRINNPGSMWTKTGFKGSGRCRFPPG